VGGNDFSRKKWSESAIHLRILLWHEPSIARIRTISLLALPLNFEVFGHSNGYYAPTLDRTDSSQYVEAPCEVVESLLAIIPSMKSFRWAMIYQSA
jgi:hypothetical protein